MKSGFYTTTDGVPPSGWTKMNLQKTSPKRSCTKRRLWPLFSGRQVESSTITSWILIKPSLWRSITTKSTKCTKNCTVFLSSTDYHFSKHPDNFLQTKVFNNLAAAKNAFEEAISSTTPEFYDIG
uniref:Uncharacterized protein n=1 Tax=Heterorhabditis bacteriophora TaxID=37862 RepID=A0A1I7XA95_HETBA